MNAATDFIGGALAYRRQHGGGKGQLIAKAIGIKPGLYPSVLDLTAGLGKDAFVLASLGCTVTMLERHPLVHEQLRLSLEMARRHAEHNDAGLLAILQRMILFHVDSRDYLQANNIEQQVLYLDPMFPERKKSAAVKKDMVALQQVVGHDADSGQLLEYALRAPVHRVVVKRPRLAPSLTALEPPLVFQGKSGRFDVYPKVAFKK